MKRSIPLFLAMVGMAANSWAADCDRALALDGHSPVSVLVVTTSPEGFTQTKQTQDSTRDLIKSLTGKKAICLAKNRDDAYVVVEVLGREKAQLTASWLGASRDVTLAAKMTVGTYETVISESAAGGTVVAGGAWSKAAGKVASRIEQWVSENRAKLIQP